MYYELIKWLREEAKFPYNDNRDLFCKAADAIEELQGKTKVLEKVADHWCNKVPKWIPVTERLPEDGTEVLAFNKTGFAYVDCWTDGKWKINSMVDEEHESVTHWMSLPQPPESEGEP